MLTPIVSLGITNQLISNVQMAPIGAFHFCLPEEGKKHVQTVNRVVAKESKSKIKKAKQRKMKMF